MNKPQHDDAMLHYLEFITTFPFGNYQGNNTKENKKLMMMSGDYLGG